MLPGTLAGLIPFCELYFRIIFSGYLIYKCQDPGYCKIEAGKIKTSLRKSVFVGMPAAFNVVICAVDV